MYKLILIVLVVSIVAFGFWILSQVDVNFVPGQSNAEDALDVIEEVQDTVKDTAGDMADAIGRDSIFDAETPEGLASKLWQWAKALMQMLGTGIVLTIPSQYKENKMTHKDRLPDGLSDLTLIDRIIVSTENFVWAKAKGIALTPEGEIGNLKQLTQCSMALKESLRKAKDDTLAQDTINVALNMAGYDIAKMNQFDKAHALLDMAQELKSYQTMHAAGLRLTGTSLT